MAILPFSSLFVSLHDICLHQSTSTTTTTTLFTCTVLSILLLISNRTSASTSSGNDTAFVNSAFVANRTLPFISEPNQRIQHPPPLLDGASLPRRVQLGKSADEYELFSGDKKNNKNLAATYQQIQRTSQLSSSQLYNPSSHPSSQPSNPHQSHLHSYHSNELITEENVDEVQGLEDHHLAALDSGTHVYTNQFVVEAEGAPEEVKKLAHEHGFLYLGHIFGNFHHLKHRKVAKRSVDGVDEQRHAPLSLHPSVLSFQQQKLKRRTKRDYLEVKSPPPTPDTKNLTKKQVIPYYSGSHHRHFQESHPQLLPFSRDMVGQNNGNDNEDSTSASSSSSNLIDNRIKFDDPQWPRMWYLNRGHGLDMNVEGAWAKNVTGRQVVVTILDDGLEKDHPDLVTNYDARASTDVNGLDEDPMPRYDIIDSNRHGTRCAGEVAANANNSVCAVGVAFDARVGGIRMLDGDVTDAVEARSLSFNPDHIDIYSASWGPDDDGRTVDGPGELAAKAFENGITKGRSGKGSIFVWASGNGGREKDNCNCDGYTNSIWTLSISSATEKGSVPWYSEACSSTLATTYSSGSFGERQIVTTDLHHGCTASHTGTSASAPLAAGICALALEANPNLSWRDMQHIVVLTAKQKHLGGHDWATNGVGRNVSHWFGYGLLDAAAMVDYARDWTPVPEQTGCEMRYRVTEDSTIHPGKTEEFEGKEPPKCDTLSYLEHVQVKVNLTAYKRGDIEIRLTSPAGTTSTLLAVRPMDNSRMGFANWPFMTVHCWGERPAGKWKLTVINHGRNNLAILHEWTLVMYGTARNPYPKEFVQKYNIPKMDNGDYVEEEEENIPNKQPSKHHSPPKIGKAPLVVQPKPPKLPSNGKSSSSSSKAPELSDNRIDAEANSSSSSSSSASSSASGSKNGISSGSSSAGNNNSKIIFVNQANNNRNGSNKNNNNGNKNSKNNSSSAHEKLPTPVELPPPPKQNLDHDYNEYEEEDDVSPLSRSHQNGGLRPGSSYPHHHHNYHHHHSHSQYMSNVERQTDGDQQQQQNAYSFAFPLLILVAFTMFIYKWYIIRKPWKLCSSSTSSSKGDGNLDEEKSSNDSRLELLQKEQSKSLLNAGTVVIMDAD